MNRIALILMMLVNSQTAFSQLRSRTDDSQGAPQSEPRVQILTRSVASIDSRAIAFRDWQRQARLGDKEAMIEVAKCFFSGKGTPKNAELGFKATLAAANAGLTQAMCDIGICYLDGVGTKRKSSEGISWVSAR